MQEASSRTPAGQALSLRPTNPDGKAAIGLLQDWRDASPRGVVAKPRPRLLAELFTSLLVLSARFGYKPAVGAANFLYCIGGEWELSLVAPDEWPDDRELRRESFAGTCVLQADRTWTIEPSDRLRENTPVARAVARFYDAFAATLDRDGVLEDILPFYAANLSYHRRLNANALSRSIRAAVTLGDQRDTPMREWIQALPGAVAPLRLQRD